MSVFDAFSLAPADLNKLCRGILALRAPSAQSQWSTIFAEDFAQNFGIGRSTIGDNLLNWGFCADDTNVLILIDGVKSADGARGVVDGYSGGLLDGFRNPTNQVLERAASDLCTQMNGLGLWRGSNTLLAGYSGGGAVAPLTPIYRTVTRANGPAVRVVSFGAPRASGLTGTNNMAEIAQKERYFFYNDPIAAFPLRSGTYTYLPFMIGIRAARRWGEFVHHRSGIQIEENGGFNNVNDPEGVAINGQMAWGVWWFGLQSTILTPHNLQTYADAFPSAPTTARTHTQRSHTPQERPESLPTSEMNRQERVAVNAFADLQQQQSAIQIRIPPARLVRAYRQGRTWFVDFGGVAIMSTPSRRRAQGMAREMNATLRRMQQTAIVDTGALETQLAEYLRLASDPTSGFQPTLNTRFPA